MSRRSWVMVTDFKTRVLRLKPEVQILGSLRSIRHTKVGILCLKSCFLRKKETKLHANLWKTLSNELFCRRPWWFHVGLLNDLHLVHRPRPLSSSAQPAMPFMNQERLVLKFPFVMFPWSLNVSLECLPLSHQVFDLETMRAKCKTYFLPKPSLKIIHGTPILNKIFTPCCPSLLMH